MTAEHRRPFVAFVVVAFACALALVNAQAPSRDTSVAVREPAARQELVPLSQALLAASSSNSVLHRVRTTAGQGAARVSRQTRDARSGSLPADARPAEARRDRGEADRGGSADDTADAPGPARSTGTALQAAPQPVPQAGVRRGSGPDASSGTLGSPGPAATSPTPSSDDASTTGRGSATHTSRVTHPRPSRRTGPPSHSNGRAKGHSKVTGHRKATGHGKATGQGKAKGHGKGQGKARGHR